MDGSLMKRLTPKRLLAILLQLIIILVVLHVCYRQQNSDAKLWDNLRTFWRQLNRSETLIDPEDPCLLFFAPDSEDASSMRDPHMLAVFENQEPKARTRSQQVKQFLVSAATVSPSVHDLCVARRLWLTFTSWCRRHSLPLMLLGNSLQGALKHQGLTPYNDSMDVLMSYRAVSLLLQLPRQGGQLGVHFHSGGLSHEFKVFWTGPGHRMTGYGWNLPCINVFLFLRHGENRLVIFDALDRIEVVQESHVMPPSEAVFEGELHLIPRCPQRLLLHRRTLSPKCCVATKDRQVCVASTDLQDLFPVVEQRRVNSSVVEEKLMFKGMTMRTELLYRPRCE